MPRRQSLLGLWMLACGSTLFVGALLAIWLDSGFEASASMRPLLWLACIMPGLQLVLVGLWLERKLFAPLRRFRVQLTRLVTNPDARQDYSPEGWLSALSDDLQQLRDGWRNDRQALGTAHDDGARDAARTRYRLEAVVQSLQTPLLLCDRHQRLLLFNHAAETLFAAYPTLGLGRNLHTLLTAASLRQALVSLPADGSPREVLIPFAERWLRGTLRRVRSGDGETLLTLEDATQSWSHELNERIQLADLLPILRRHAASLTTAIDVLGQAPQLRHRLEGVIEEESQALNRGITQLAAVVDTLALQGERLIPTWSNDLWQGLDARLKHHDLTLIPIGTPAWFRADVPALLPLLSHLLERLAEHTGCRRFEVEACLGDRRVYLDLVWAGHQLSQQNIATWRNQLLDELPLSPSLDDILRQHDSDAWSLADEDGRHARLRLPLHAVMRVGFPQAPPPPRPEFHDFDIADLPSPKAELASLPLRQLEIVAFDTETTGLELADGDRVISLGACRIVNGRMLAADSFDQLIDPQRSIPASSTFFHGLVDSDVAGAPPLRQVLPRFVEYQGNAVLLAHNAAFDLRALQPLGCEGSLNGAVLDTLLLSRALEPSLDEYDLDSLAERFALPVPPGARHTALGDARITAALWLALLPRLEARGIETLDDALKLQAGGTP